MKIKKVISSFLYENILRKDDKSGVAPFSIIASIYESEMDKKYGIVLGKLKNGERIYDIGKLEKNISFSEKGGPSFGNMKYKLMERYEDVPGFCSMEVQDSQELLRHISKIYELSYSHYAWAKQTNMKDSFPQYCCMSSSKNLLLMLMDKGFPNASIIGDFDKDHLYIGLPFIIKNPRGTGFIIADPTSDQLFEDKTHAPKNNIFISKGKTWKYETDWAEGQDLYPDRKNSSVFVNLHILRKSGIDSLRGEMHIKKYFKNVFKNPVKI